MKIDATLVRHVAGLAHLELTADEVSYYETQLGKILVHIAQLDLMPDRLPKDWRSDTAGAPTPERDDVRFESLPIDVALGQAPRRSDSAFQVPRIIE